LSKKIYSYGLFVSDEDRNLMSNRALNATNKMNAPLTPLPKNEVQQFQGNYLPPFTSGPQK